MVRTAVPHRCLSQASLGRPAVQLHRALVESAAHERSSYAACAQTFLWLDSAPSRRRGPLRPQDSRAEHAEHALALVSRLTGCSCGNERAIRHACAIRPSGAPTHERVHGPRTHPAPGRSLHPCHLETVPKAFYRILAQPMSPARRTFIASMRLHAPPCASVDQGRPIHGPRERKQSNGTHSRVGGPRTRLRTYHQSRPRARRRVEHNGTLRGRRPERQFR